jgi:dTDP-4-amino-4,6-dideoxygalactose transaminase
MRRPRRERFLPFVVPGIGEEEIAGVVDALRSGWITTGPRVKAFEDALAAYVGAPHAIAVSSATAGLHLALAALDVGPGDEVIVPTMTFASTANVVRHLGATPVLVDVGPDFNVAAAQVADALTSRTRAVIPVHFGGQPCDLDPILEVARRAGLAVVEDAAHAVGARYRERGIGTVGDVTVFSFYATKNLTTGEGGMITTGDAALADRLRRLTLHGMSRDAWKRYTSVGSWYYEITEAGYKANMTDLQAAIGLPQLARLPAALERRRRLAARYTAALAAAPHLTLPPVHGDRRHAWHLFVVLLRLEALRCDRAAVIDALREENIGTSVHFIPVHLHPAYRAIGYKPGDFPRAEALYAATISLPLYPSLADDDVDAVVAALTAILEERSII